MKRARLTVTVDGPPGYAGRLFDCLRDYGYTVEEKEAATSTHVKAEVQVPYGETNKMRRDSGKRVR